MLYVRVYTYSCLLTDAAVPDVSVRTWGSVADVVGIQYCETGLWETNLFFRYKHALPQVHGRLVPTLEHNNNYM